MQERKTTDWPAPLRDARILAVEDDFVVLLEVTSVLHDAGAAAVRTSGTVEQALELIETEAFSAAVLDVRLGRQTIAPVARKLTELGTPFVFYTGQLPNESTLGQWPRAPIVSKPASPAQLVQAVVEVLRTDAAATGSQNASSLQRATLREHLAQAEQHVAAGKQRVTRQRKIVETLRHGHSDSSSADALLEQLEATLSLEIARRDLLRDELRKSG